jgi:mRNA-degrading endonuclease RelE of RelBE toxin-antitoxin system
MLGLSQHPPGGGSRRIHKTARSGVAAFVVREAAPKARQKHRQNALCLDRQNLNGTDNPYAKGKALVGDRKDSWHYRVGAYRIIVEIRNNELVVLVLAVGNCKDIYGS